MKKRILAVLVCLLLILTACAPVPEETRPGEPETAATAAPETTAPTAETAAEETTAAPTEPQPVLHSGLREDGSFDEGTWFIGDSMTCILISDYLRPNGLLGDAWYTGRYGARVVGFFDESVTMTAKAHHCEFRPEHENMGYAQVARELGEQVTAIYMMFGTNHTIDAGPEAYIEIVDYLLETCPNATIHLEMIPWGYFVMVKFDEVNGWLRESLAHYQALGEERVMLIDTFTAIGENTDEGYIHLNYQGNENWYHAIVAHAQENNLPQ